MKILNTLAAFVDKLPTVVSKKDAELTLESLEKNILQLKAAHNTYFKYTDRNPVKSKIGLEIEARVKATMKNLTVGEVIGLGLATAERHIQELEKAVKKYLDEDNPRDTMTYNKVGIIKLIDLYGFWFDYSMSIMRYISANEINEMTAAEPLYTKGFARKIEENLGSWLVFSDIVIQRTDLNKVIDATTDMVVVSKDQYATAGDSKKDPARLGFIGTYFNIPYMINDLLADLYVWRYDYFKNQKQEIIMHIEYLESITADGDNPRVLKQISINSDKLKVIENRLKKMEEETLD